MDTVALKIREKKLLRRMNEILPVLKRFEEEVGEVAGRPAFDWRDPNQSEAYLVDRLTACYQRELEDIEKALRRIRSGTFGSCRSCHQRIEPARLDRFLQAEFCSLCNSSN